MADRRKEKEGITGTAEKYATFKVLYMFLLWIHEMSSRQFSNHRIQNISDFTSTLLALCVTFFLLFRLLDGFYDFTVQIFSSYNNTVVLSECAAKSEVQWLATGVANAAACFFHYQRTRSVVLVESIRLGGNDTL